MSSWAVVLALVGCLRSASGAGFRVEKVGGGLVNFTWHDATGPNGVNYSAAAAFCRHLHPKGRLPAATELRFFFKTLSATPRPIFYLADILEATTDHPEDRLGERLCLVVSKGARGANGVVLAEDEARASCIKKANLIVCRYDIQKAQATPTMGPEARGGMYSLTTPAVERSRAVGDVCLDPDLFYGALSGAGAILLLLTLLCAVLATYAWRQTRANTGPVEEHLLPTLSRTSSKRSSYRGAPGAAIMTADYLSRHQAAAIGSHLHREPSQKMAQASMLL